MKKTASANADTDPSWQTHTRLSSNVIVHTTGPDTDSALPPPVF